MKLCYIERHSSGKHTIWVNAQITVVVPKIGDTVIIKKIKFCVVGNEWHPEENSVLVYIVKTVV